ncbi:Myosin-VIIa [Trichoplax sp. H2]|nr:Myosin-VIIa [Trichoplax sp. H2]|eukprot:RDD41603.1 Myosin-VIIa [Trichoplax sp. H2]
MLFTILEMIIEHLEACEVSNPKQVKMASTLFQVRASDLSEVLTNRTTLTGGEKIYSPVELSKAINIRDALAKGIYSRLFVWIVNKINHSIYKFLTNKAHHRTSIGVLDIFGFEKLETNSFEQLCINFANESLQQYFVKYIFKLEQSEYTKEGINWQGIKFTDNQNILDMIAYKQMNIISIIDEESRFPRGTDSTMLSKLHQHHAKNSAYVKPKSQMEANFGIRHYAGVVKYQSREMLEKNRDTFGGDLLEVVKSSGLVLLRELFEKDLAQESRKMPLTVGIQFKKSLDSLLRTLGDCQPMFIRCIKPNNGKQPKVFDRLVCTRQLRYSGMMETIKIRVAGYPVRHLYTDFIKRYGILDSKLPHINKIKSAKDASSRIMAKINVKSGYQLGKTKLFLKDNVQESLEKAREESLHKSVITIQKTYRGYLCRSSYIELRNAVIVIQKNWKAKTTREKYIKMSTGFTRLQAIITSNRIANDYKAKRNIICRLQPHLRGYLVRQDFKIKKASVIRIQSMIRMMIARKLYRQAIEQKRRREEIEQIRISEEKKLAKKMDKEKARKQAEVLQQQRLQEIEKAKQDNEERERREFQEKQIRIELAKSKADEEVDHSQVVDQMFDFLPPDDEKTESTPDLSETTKDVRNSIKKSSSTTMEDNISNYQFSKFAATYFVGDATGVILRKPIKRPLLDLVNEQDRAIALSIWIAILRFMGDLPEPKAAAQPSPLQPQQQIDDTDAPEASLSIIHKLYNKTIGRKAPKHKKFLESQSGDSVKSGRSGSYGKSVLKYFSISQRKKSKHRTEISSITKQGKEEELDATIKEAAGFLQKHTTNLEKIRFIIGHGIQRKDLRDEIYCQLCKQLTENHLKSSYARGWILMSLCLGCFTPSSKLEKYLVCFIREGPAGYAPYCEERLNRTYANGARQQPPCWLELQATKLKEPINIPLTFMDGTNTTATADSATTAKELCAQLAQKKSMKEKFGFSLYIALHDKVSCLGSGDDHVMDAVAQCEVYAREQGYPERHTPWRMFFRKEIFAPWQNGTNDPVSTNLIYYQIIRGVQHGEYKCDKDEELAEIAAQQYYIEYGGHLKKDKLCEMLDNYIPKSSLQGTKQSKVIDKWAMMVSNSFKKAYYTQNRIERQQVKEGLVNFAMNRWPLFFSRFYEAFKFSGPSLPKNEVIIAVNWTGIYIVDEYERLLAECSYPELANVTSTMSSSKHGSSFSFTTIKGDEYMFTSTNGEDIKNLVGGFLDGLRQRSKYVVAIMDYSNPSDGSSVLSFKKGDLIKLSDLVKDISSHVGWKHGNCLRTGRSGDFPAECVYQIPTLVKPPDDIVEALANYGSQVYRKNLNGGLDPNRVDESSYDGSETYTLESYAQENFTPYKKSMQKTISRSGFRRKEKDRSWICSREPIKHPLLKNLIEQDELCSDAVRIFLAIMKYMGDYPSRKSRHNTELTDAIFEPAILQKVLCDEVYCQIMKQLTENKISQSEERGWELFWLCTGCLLPTNSLVREVNTFLVSRKVNNPIAQDCISRLRKLLSKLINAPYVFATSRSGPRKYPPHVVEVQAIQQKTIKLMHKIYFPDESYHAFDISSSIKARDLCQAIIARMQLTSGNGFSLFVRMADKFVSIPEGDYLFDFIRHVSEWVKANIRGKEDKSPGELAYQLYFMRKLWSDVVVGADRNADLIFHYHQELPKYLRGYHKCAKEDAIRLAALQYRVKHGDDNSELNNIQRLLRDLVPYDAIGNLSAEEWEQAITESYTSGRGMTKHDAKIAFLQEVEKWATFGSAFFDIKQTTGQELPENLLIAINKGGVFFINPINKKIITQYPFTKISSWSSGNAYFHMTIGDSVNGMKLLCETHLGYKMDDLLTSYISQLIATKGENNSGQ